MALPNGPQAKWCYERCEELVPQIGRLERALEEIAQEHDEYTEHTAKIVEQLREIQGKLAANALK